MAPQDQSQAAAGAPAPDVYSRLGALEERTRNQADSIKDAHTRVGDVDVKVDERLGLFEKKLDDKLGNLDKKLDDKLGNFDKKLDDKFVGLSAQIAELKELASGAKGGWKALATMGALVTALVAATAGIANAMSHISFH